LVCVFAGVERAPAAAREPAARPSEAASARFRWGRVAGGAPFCPGVAPVRAGGDRQQAPEESNERHSQSPALDAAPKLATTITGTSPP
jgi:hypothetical protein